ncbi:hypothetical protein V6N13_080208 [Hibiscus sabdariffa]
MFSACDIPEVFWWDFPLFGVSSVGKPSVRLGLSWVSPLTGVLKFNVDGSMFRSSSKVECGGVCRDDEGRILDMFSVQYGRIDLNEVEVQAFNHALALLLDSRWCMSLFLVVELDSTVADSWVIVELESTTKIACQVVEKLNFG